MPVFVENVTILPGTDDISKELVTIDSGDIKSWPNDEGIRDDSTVEDEEERQCQE
jgi:hypothetical protein